MMKKKLVHKDGISPSHIRFRMNDDFFLQTIESLEDYAIFTTDIEGNITSWNRGAERVLCYKEKEIIGKNASLFFTKKDIKNKAPEKELKRARTNGSSEDERWHVRKDGSLFWASGKVFILKDEAGKIIGFTKIMRDRTEWKLLQENLLMHSQVLECMAEGVSVSDENGIIIYTNSTEDRMFGYRRGELIGKHVTIQNTYPPQENKRIVNEVINQLKQKGVWYGEFSNVKKDGTPFTTFARITSIEMSGKKFWVCVQEDITERKNSEQKLKYQTALLEAQKEATPDGILVVGKEGEILSFNQNFVKMWHIPKHLMKNPNDDELLKHVLNQLSDPEGFVKRVNEIYRNAHQLSHEEILFKDGRVFERFGIPVEGVNGTYYGFAWYFRDITDRKLVERKLRQSEAQFRLIVENSIDMIMLLDTTGKFLYASPSHKHGIGYTQKELIGTSAFDIVLPEDLPFAQQKFMEALQGKLAILPRLRVRHKNRKIVITEGMGSAIFDEAGRPDKVVAVFRDITERVELDQKKDEFIGIASHELKTPLTTIKAFTQLLKRKYDKDKDPILSKYLNRMEVQLNKLTTLVYELLDVSRITTGKLKLNKEQFDFSVFIHEIIDDLQSTFVHHHIILKDSIKHKIYADPYRIGQVLTNLILNAVKYSPHSKKIIITVHQQDADLLISVQDFGVGIAQVHQEKIFERFYRAFEHKGEKFPGLGIGLYISSEIIKRHGGRIWVDSEEGKGSTFYFTLPLNKKD